MAKWKKIASSENGLDLWALSWLLAPHPLWSAFTPTTPRPPGVIREPPNGAAGHQPISYCLFSNQITIFNGDTSPGPSPNRHLFEIVPRNYFTQKFSLCNPPPLHSSPHFGLLFVVVCFQLNLPLWTANGQKWAGGSEREGFRVGGEGLAPGTAVTEICSQRRKAEPARGFWFSTKQVFHSEQGAAFTLRGPEPLPAHNDVCIRTITLWLLYLSDSMLCKHG